MYHTFNFVKYNIDVFKNMEYTASIIDFTEILPFWKNFLWPNRQDKIRPLNDIVYQGGHDAGIYITYIPTFFAVHNLSGDIVGVNSGHKTTIDVYRSRGLWVHSEYRLLGISNLLLQAVCEQAVKENCNMIWSIPRKAALAAYEKNGFLKSSNFFDEGMAFGPNCYAYKMLR